MDAELLFSIEQFHTKAHDTYPLLINLEFCWQILTEHTGEFGEPTYHQKNKIAIGLQIKCGESIITALKRASSQLSCDHIGLWVRLEILWANSTFFLIFKHHQTYVSPHHACVTHHDCPIAHLNSKFSMKEPNTVLTFENLDWNWHSINSNLEADTKKSNSTLCIKIVKKAWQW